jgi:hypothetical protein
MKKIRYTRKLYYSLITDGMGIPGLFNTNSGRHYQDFSIYSDNCLMRFIKDTEDYITHIGIISTMYVSIGRSKELDARKEIRSMAIIELRHRKLDKLVK